MKSQVPADILKPLLRGHFHQAAFFIAIGACLMLVAHTQVDRTLAVTLIYSLSLIAMFGISASYHRINWQSRGRAIMRRFDHAAIFLLIAGTGTPICWLALQPADGLKLLGMLWFTAIVGILQVIFWPRAPKWIAVGLYLLCGWTALPFLSAIATALGTSSVRLLVGGGILYSAGALIYAFKKPNPYPRVFGYHEIFHVLVNCAATLHFIVVMRLVN